MKNRKFSHTFCVADFMFKVVLDNVNGDNGARLLPSFGRFLSHNNTSPESLLFTMTVKDSIDDAGVADEIGCFDNGNGDIIVHRTISDGYFFIIKHACGKECCRLVSNSDFSLCQCVLYGDVSKRSYGLNTALMLVYALATCPYETLLMHASCVVNNGKAYTFIAPSGTGKSTHSELWMRNIANTHLLNDDNPVLRIFGDTVVIYGSPWSGKTPCYRQEHYPAGAIVKISRAPANSIERLDTVRAIVALLPSFSSMKSDERLHDIFCNTLGKIISLMPVYNMHCLPDNEAALICYNEVAKK